MRTTPCSRSTSRPGLVVHPAAGHRSGTLVNALIHHRGEQLARRGGENRLGLVHRLDKDTSGLMLIAKTDDVHEKLAPAFAQRRGEKILSRALLGRLPPFIGRMPRSASAVIR